MKWSAKRKSRGSKQRWRLIARPSNQRVDEFIDAAASFAAQRYREDARRAVTEMPELAREKGQAGLAPLKAEITGLENTAPELARKHLDVDELWRHRAPPSELGGDGRWGGASATEYRFDGGAAPGRLNQAVRALLGEVAAPLERHGFLGDDPAWERRDGVYRYRRDFDWSPEMEAALERYAELYGELWDLHTQLRKARAELGPEQAGALWDKA